jgi:hypothetical protein
MDKLRHVTETRIDSPQHAKGESVDLDAGVLVIFSDPNRTVGAYARSGTKLRGYKVRPYIEGERRGYLIDLEVTDK